MWSVNNDDESFETAAAAVAWEQMVTACGMWASVKAHSVLKIKLTAWTCEVRRRRTRQLLETLKTKARCSLPREQLLRRGFHCRACRIAARSTMIARCITNLQVV